MTCTKTTHNLSKKMHNEVSFEVLNKVHDFLGILIRENLIKEAPFLDEEPMLMVSDLADDLWEVIHRGTRCNIEKGTDSHRQGNEYKPMTLNEAIAHAEESVNDTPCGRAHKQLADWLKELKEIKNTNAAKMREALLMVKKLFDGRIMFQQVIREAHKAVSTALAEPPRNVDRFNTLQEVIAYWREHGDEIDIPLLHWLFAEMKGEAK